jgi:hypothetical protein
MKSNSQSAVFSGCWLSDKGYSPEFTLNLIREKKYIDWNEQATIYQINHILKKGNQMTSCHKLLFYALYR